MSKQYTYGWQEFTGNYDDYESIDFDKHAKEVNDDSTKNV